MMDTLVLKVADGVATGFGYASGNAICPPELSYQQHTFHIYFVYGVKDSVDDLFCNGGWKDAAKDALEGSLFPECADWELELDDWELVGVSPIIEESQPKTRGSIMLEVTATNEESYEKLSAYYD